jgi:hypothetical protein
LGQQHRESASRHPERRALCGRRTHDRESPSSRPAAAPSDARMAHWFAHGTLPRRRGPARRAVAASRGGPAPAAPAGTLLQDAPAPPGVLEAAKEELSP